LAIAFAGIMGKDNVRKSIDKKVITLLFINKVYMSDSEGESNIFKESLIILSNTNNFLVKSETGV